jgi:hypothetical protein
VRIAKHVRQVAAVNPARYLPADHREQRVVDIHELRLRVQPS